MSHWLDEAAVGLAGARVTRRHVVRDAAVAVGGAFLASVAEPVAALANPWQHCACRPKSCCAPLESRTPSQQRNYTQCYQPKLNKCCHTPLPSTLSGAGPWGDPYLCAADEACCAGTCCQRSEACCTAPKSGVGQCYSPQRQKCCYTDTAVWTCAAAQECCSAPKSGAGLCYSPQAQKCCQTDEVAWTCPAAAVCCYDYSSEQSRCCAIGEVCCGGQCCPAGFCNNGTCGVVQGMPYRFLGSGVALTSGTTQMKSFPAVCRIPGTSNLLMLYRVGTSDFSSDGSIYKMVLHPNGDGTVKVVKGETLQWSPAPGWDLREPCLCALANGTIACIYLNCVGGSSNPAQFMFERVISADGGETWSAPATVDTGASPGGQIVQTADGNLYWASYVNLTSTLYRSTDNGVTWTNVGLIAAQDGLAYEEPCLTVLADGMTLLCYLRTYAYAEAVGDSTQFQGYVTKCSNPGADTPVWSTPQRAVDTNQKTAVLYTPDGDVIANPAVPDDWPIMAYRLDWITSSGDGGETWSPASWEASPQRATGGRYYGALCWIGPPGSPYNVALVVSCQTTTTNGNGYTSNVFWIPVGQREPFYGTVPQPFIYTSLPDGPPWPGVLEGGASLPAGYSCWVAMDENGYVHFGGKIIPGSARSNTGVEILQLPNQGFGWAPHQDVYLPVLLESGLTSYIKVDTRGRVYSFAATIDTHILDGLSFKANAP